MLNRLGRSRSDGDEYQCGEQTPACRRKRELLRKGLIAQSLDESLQKDASIDTVFSINSNRPILGTRLPEPSFFSGIFL
jgi:hypothetical protein